MHLSRNEVQFLISKYEELVFQWEDQVESWLGFIARNPGDKYGKIYLREVRARLGFCRGRLNHWKAYARTTTSPRR